MKLFSIKRQIPLKDENVIHGFFFSCNNTQWSVFDHIIPPCWFNTICRSYRTLTFSCIFNIAMLCEHNSSEVVDPIVIIYDTMIGLDVYSTILFNRT